MARRRPGRGVPGFESRLRPDARLRLHARHLRRYACTDADHGGRRRVAKTPAPVAGPLFLQVRRRVPRASCPRCAAPQAHIAARAAHRPRNRDSQARGARPEQPGDRSTLADSGVDRKMAPQERVREAGRQHPDRRDCPRTRTAIAGLTQGTRQSLSSFQVPMSAAARAVRPYGQTFTYGAWTMAMNRFLLLL